MHTARAMITEAASNSDAIRRAFSRLRFGGGGLWDSRLLTSVSNSRNEELGNRMHDRIGYGDKQNTHGDVQRGLQ